MLSKRRVAGAFSQRKHTGSVHPAMAADAPRRSARLAQSVESVPRINHRVKSQHVSASHCVARRVKSGRSLGWALDDCESVSSNRSRVKEGKRSIQIRVPEKDVQHISSEKYDIDVVGVASNVAQSSRAVPDSDEVRILHVCGHTSPILWVYAA